MYLNLKSIAVLFTLFIATSLNAQNVTVTQPETNVVYRGYENRILVNIPDCTSETVNDVVLHCSNCTLSKVNKPGGYILKPGMGRKCVVTINSEEDGVRTAIDSIEYRVSNLPDPVLYWGASKSGVKASKSSRLLMAKYPPEIPHKASFKITKWTIVHDGETVVGLGGNLSAASEIIKSLESGEQLCITATVVGPDGIARQVAGGWNL